MKFRLHRGTLADSMDTLAELQPTRTAIVAHVNRNPMYCTTELSIRIEPYGGPDTRIGWNAVYLVSDHAGVIGFCDAPVER